MIGGPPSYAHSVPRQPHRFVATPSVLPHPRKRILDGILGVTERESCSLLAQSDEAQLAGPVRRPGNQEAVVARNADEVRVNRVPQTID